ncbi:MAG TPA: MarR family transcriptional regulator [Nocardioides sp.]|nr:MarR family transcriptional regulator [Nocardioides sp.]
MFEAASSSPAESLGRRMFRLVEPIGVVTYQAAEPTETLMALGLRNVWDAYFAGRAAALGRVPAEVVHALFYNFAEGEAARHIPRVWEMTTPEAALAARQQGSVAALRRILGDLSGVPGLARAADLATRAATDPPMEGRPMYAALRRLPVPEEPVARLWHAATLLREHRGDGHVAALVGAGIGGTECHVLHALSEGMPAERFGRIHHLPSARLAAVIDGMRSRGLVDESGLLSDLGRTIKERIESLTDDLAAPAYAGLSPSELDRLIADLKPISAALDAVGSQ